MIRSVGNCYGNGILSYRDILCSYTLAPTNSPSELASFAQWSTKALVKGLKCLAVVRLLVGDEVIDYNLVLVYFTRPLLITVKK